MRRLEESRLVFGCQKPYSNPVHHRNKPSTSVMVSSKAPKSIIKTRFSQCPQRRNRYMSLAQRTFLVRNGLNMSGDVRRVKQGPKFLCNLFIVPHDDILKSCGCRQCVEGRVHTA